VVRITQGENGPESEVGNLKYNTEWVGIQNVLYWQMDIQKGTEYFVEVRDVIVAGEMKTYVYWFRVD